MKAMHGDCSIGRNAGERFTDEESSHPEQRMSEQ
jgi:hypothetical protein